VFRDTLEYQEPSFQLYVRDLQTGTTKLVSIAPDGTESGDADVGDDFQLSADGSTVVFDTYADNLVANFNGSSNVFAYSTASFTAPAGVLKVSASPIHAVEGTSFTGVVASFTDTDGDPVGSYTATIDWNDGSTSQGTITANADGSFNVTGTHTFAEAGFYPIGITVSDSDGSTASASATVVETNPSGDITYPIEVDTSALKGTTGALALQFNPGATPNAQAAGVRVSNLIVAGGSLTSALTSQGGASGSLAGTAQLTNSAVLNEIEQGITFGSSVRFDITIAGAAVEQPGNGDFGSTFAVQFLGADGVTPQSTIDPSGAVNTVDVNPDGSTRVTNFASSAQGGVPVAGTANVADAPLLATGTTLQASAGTPFPAVIATFTDANPQAQLADYTATITWGNGQTFAGTITPEQIVQNYQLIDSGTFDVTGTHTYARGGTFLASVTVDDIGGSVATAATTISVSLLAPTVSATNDSTTFTGSPQAYPGSDVAVTGANGLNNTGGTLSYTYNGSTTVPTTAGNYAVVVTFAPTDANDYSSAFGTATWTIKAGTPTVLPAKSTVVRVGVNILLSDTGGSLPPVLTATVPGSLPGSIPAVQVGTTAVVGAPSLLQRVESGAEDLEAGPQVFLVLRDVPTEVKLTEGETLTFTAWAGYGDRPAEHPLFSLEPVVGASFPKGAAIDPKIGVFSWRATAGNYTFLVRVRDGNNTVEQLIDLWVEEANRDALWAVPAEDWAAAGLGGELLARTPDNVFDAAFMGETGGGQEPAASALEAGACEKPGDAVLLAALTALAAYAAWPRAVPRWARTHGLRHAPVRAGV